MRDMLLAALCFDRESMERVHARPSQASPSARTANCSNNHPVHFPQVLDRYQPTVIPPIRVNLPGFANLRT